jgi:DNA invertase Pin-like site-specific DNA recombinase
MSFQIYFNEMSSPPGRPAGSKSKVYGPRERVNQSKYDEILRRLAAGESQSNIARHFGHTRQYIWNIAHKNGYRTNAYDDAMSKQQS